MSVNLNKPERWRADIAQSVDLYNTWFLKFAPKTYRDEWKKATEKVAAMLEHTNYLRNLTPEELKSNPENLFALRMSTAPPIARDRLVGLRKPGTVTYFMAAFRCSKYVNTSHDTAEIAKNDRLSRRTLPGAANSPAPTASARQAMPGIASRHGYRIETEPRCSAGICEDSLEQRVDERRRRSPRQDDEEPD